MTPPASPAPAPRHPRRRGGRGQAAGSAPGDLRLTRLFADLETILRLETIRLAVRHQRSEIVALGDPVTGVIPAKVGVAHLRRLRRHRQQVGAMALPLAEGACPSAAPAPACIRNEPAQSASRVDSKVDKTKPPGPDPVAGAPISADALVTSAAVGTAHPEFDKTKPRRAGTDVPFNKRAPAPRGRAREEPANLALLGLAMLKLSRQ